MRILAVDDDKYVLDLLEAILKANGFEDFTLADSAAAALRILSNEALSFDCILLDIQMPEMDGIELCRVIRKLPQYHSCPILMITAMTERDYVDRAFSAGATDYVSKPFDPMEIGTRIRLAEKLVKEQQVATGAAIDEAFGFSIDDPVKIDDVPGAIDKLVMENYLLQLTRGKIFQSTAVGIAIQNFESLWDRSNLSDIYMTLVDVAEAIALNLSGKSYLFSYCGRGRFVCVTQRNLAGTFDNLAQNIQASMDEFGLPEDDDVWIVLGEPITMSLWDSGNPLQLIDDAIASVDRHTRNVETASERQSIWNRINGVFNSK